jgi:hypothetical protein
MAQGVGLGGPRRLNLRTARATPHGHMSCGGVTCSSALSQGLESVSMVRPWGCGAMGIIMLAGGRGAEEMGKGWGLARTEGLGRTGVGGLGGVAPPEPCGPRARPLGSAVLGTLHAKGKLGPGQRIS